MTAIIISAAAAIISLIAVFIALCRQKERDLIFEDDEEDIDWTGVKM